MIGIPYLEDEDFNPDNSLKQYVGKGKPVLVMIQGAFCHFCSDAKPAFQQLASSISSFICVTLQVDGLPSEKQASQRISKLDSSYRGVPTYFIFDAQGRFVKVHQGGRDANSLKMSMQGV